MALSWNEIKERAITFSKEWENDFNEDAEAKSFLDGFFNVFGVPRRRVASFEENVKKDGGKQGYIDLLWKGVILIEMKSRGKDLDKAHKQAKDYFPGLKDHELPKYILVCDFENFKLYDLEENTIHNFKLHELIKNVQHFGFIAGYIKNTYKEQDPVNIKAAELMGKLHDRLKEIGYEGHPLEVYLVRILFCLFAEDTNIFEKQQFQNYIEQRTNEDGSDLAAKLQELFQVLNTPKEKRFKNLDEQLTEFEYVNGKLFEEPLPMASFDGKMRQALLECCYMDWSKISPAIFGSMFQSVMNPKERRNLGAHYTSEVNILKLIKPLFLDELWTEFEKIKNSTNKLNEFHGKLSRLKFLDPACGCGNFLIITYRELRLLELGVVKAIQKGQQVIDLKSLIKLNVDQFYGIEYEEFPVRIAEVAMYLIDHQMNMEFSVKFGLPFKRLPLKKSATIIHGNALQIDWGTLKNKETLYVYTDDLNYKVVQEPQASYGTVNVITKNKPTEVALDKEFPKAKQTNSIHYDYILGNPPFSGSKVMSQTMRNEVTAEFGNIQGSGVMDYVTAWYIKAAKYIQGTKIKAAFVSTNSIVQGEQVAILWGQLLNVYSIKIHFAHRTFQWNNEARGVAAVYCVIIGFANFDTDKKTIFDYEDIKDEPHAISAKNINPYLVDARDILINRRNKPISNVPQMYKGSQPTDGGNLLFSEDEKNDFLKLESKAKKYIKPFISAHEFIHGENRFCLWLVNAEPSELKQMPHLLKRIEAVRQMRLKSTKQATVKWASQPTLFTENRQPETNYVLVPSHSSEYRIYIPMGFMSKNDILNNSCFSIPSATLYHFGILESKIHMAWVNAVCGRLESRYRYSNEIVYTNFPFPENSTEKQRQTIEKAAQKILDVRAKFPKSSLADLYDPITMPPELVKAHNELDKSVDLAYGIKSAISEEKRLEFLFNLYENYTADLFTKEKTSKKKKS